MRSFTLLSLVGFFGSLLGCTKENGDQSHRYVIESTFRQNLATQLKMSPQVLARLRSHGVTDQTSLKLEFFFYTDEDAKGQALAKLLVDLGYQTECASDTGDSRLIIVTGWKTAMKIADEVVGTWTEKMCRLGYEYDCNFDGWGAFPSP